MVKIIDSFNTEDGALIECSCGERFFIFGIDNEKQCACGKTYIVKAIIEEIIGNQNQEEKE